MLDGLFSLMNFDDFSKWRIHTRLRTTFGDVQTTLPHELADGRRILRDLLPTLASFRSQNSDLSASDGSASVTLRAEPEQTRFQAYLKHLLDNVFPKAGNIALGIDLSSQAIEGLSTQNNQVAFPIFTREELLALIRADKATWISTLTQKGITEFGYYASLAPRLAAFSKEKRAAIFKRFPINTVDVVVSYFGRITDFVDVSSSTLNAFSCAVTVTRGPKYVHVCYGKGDLIYSCTSSEGAETFDWNENERVVEVTR